jgi:hypothetical protein
MNKITINLLAELAHEIEISDPINWDYLNIDERTAYQMMATHVIELTDDILTLKASLVKMLVENFVLNVKLRQCKDLSNEVKNA